MVMLIETMNAAAWKRAKMRDMLDKKEKLVEKLEADLNSIPINDKTESEREKRKERIMDWYDWIKKKYDELNKLELDH
jgi:hypothetical protein